MDYDKNILKSVEYQNMLEKQRRMNDKLRMKDELDNHIKNQEMKKQVIYPKIRWKMSIEWLKLKIIKN